MFSNELLLLSGASNSLSLTLEYNQNRPIQSWSQGYWNEGAGLVLPLQKTNWEGFKKTYRNDWRWDNTTLHLFNKEELKERLDRSLQGRF